MTDVCSMTQVVPRLNKILQYKSESSTTNTSPSVMTMCDVHCFRTFLFELCPASINQEKGTGYFAKCLKILKPCQEPFRGVGRTDAFLAVPPLTAHHQTIDTRPHLR